MGMREDACGEVHSASFAAMGARWSVRVWDALGEQAFAEIADEAERWCADIERLYSRFLPDSFVSSLAGRTGILPVPPAFVEILRLYERIHAASNGACNPLIGAAMEDIGYDAAYSLRERATVRPVPALPDALRVVDDERIELRQPVQFDLGAAGKGYAVDGITALLKGRGLRRFLVDGSGDILYSGDGVPARAGLEHPDNATKAIGVVTLMEGALCASAPNRRRWGARHHILDPRSLQSPSGIAATWVRAKSVALADIAATTLFLVDDPAAFAEAVEIEYCILTDEHHVRCSPGFTAEFF